MTFTDHGCHDRARPGWEHLGRAAERFARRMADDAKLFAERVEEHVGEFTHDLRRQWRHTGPRPTGSADDVRRIFDDVRGIVRGVLDGIDELVSGFGRDEADGTWTKVVLNRDATCAACGKTAETGSEAWLRRTAGEAEFRCGECGEPAA